MIQVFWYIFADMHSEWERSSQPMVSCRFSLVFCLAYFNRNLFHKGFLGLANLNQSDSSTLRGNKAYKPLRSGTTPPEHWHDWLENPPWRKMYSLLNLKMGIFQCHDSFQGCDPPEKGCNPSWQMLLSYLWPVGSYHLSSTLTNGYQKIGAHAKRQVLWDGNFWGDSFWDANTSCRIVRSFSLPSLEPPKNVCCHPGSDDCILGGVWHSKKYMLYFRAGAHAELNIDPQNAGLDDVSPASKLGCLCYTAEN